MKVWILLALTLLVVSGCSTKTQNRQLRAMNAKQSAIIRQQQAQINALQSKIRTRELMRKTARMKANRRKMHQPMSVPQAPKKNSVPQVPKKNIVLKKVEDTNYSSQYMYPDAKKRVSNNAPVKKSPSTIQTTSNVMTKAECISMIGQDKFDKYTRMFGNEAASLKRCRMLKTMKQ